MTTRRRRGNVSIEPKEVTPPPQEPEEKEESNNTNVNPVEESSDVEATTKSLPADATVRPKEERYRERIIERIIILPREEYESQPYTGYQSNFQPSPPPFNSEDNYSEGGSRGKRKRRKSNKKQEFSAYDYNTEERLIYPPPRPMAENLPPPQPSPPPVIVYQQPVMCCKHYREDDSDDSDQEDEDQSLDTATFMSFANMVFAAANVMSGFPDAYK